MTIDLYVNRSEDNKIGKSLAYVDQLTGELRQQCSIQNPVITIEATDLSGINYLYIEEFDRYYFVRDCTVIRNNLWQLSCHVDVLESFKSAILDQTAIIARQERLFNLYQQDEMFKVYSKPILDEIAWSSGFDDWSYFVALAGSTS